jgi:hypothetical protein
MVEENFIQEEYVPEEGSIEFKYQENMEEKRSIEPKPEIKSEIKPKQEKQEVTKKTIEKKKIPKTTKEPKPEAEIKKQVPIQKQQETQEKTTQKQPKEDTMKNKIMKYIQTKKETFKKTKIQANSIITLIAIIAIIFISIFILNINKIFPDQGQPIAIVNGELISSADLEATLKTVPEMYKALITEEVVLNQTIINTLLLQEAKELDIKATKKEVNQALGELIESAQLSEKEFDKYLKEQNLTLEEIKEFYEVHLSIDKLLAQEVNNNIEITEEETEEFYNNNQDLFEDTNLEEAKDSIQVFLTQQKESESFNEYIADLMKSADIKIIKQEEQIQENIFSTEEVEKYSNCALEHGLTKDTIVFVYSNNCPYCKKMQPIVTDLELDDYIFKWASPADSEAKTLLRNCFSDVLEGGVPQFICAKNGASLMGERPKAVLKEFADSCRI